MDLMLKNELYNPSFEDGNISELKSEPKNKVEINSMGLMEKSKEVTVNGNADRNDARSGKRRNRNLYPVNNGK